MPLRKHTHLYIIVGPSQEAYVAQHNGAPPNIFDSFFFVIRSVQFVFQVICLGLQYHFVFNLQVAWQPTAASSL